MGRNAGNAGMQGCREAGAGMKVARAGMWLPGQGFSCPGRDAAPGTGMQGRHSREESGRSRDTPSPLSLQPLTLLHHTQQGADEGNTDGKSWQEPVQVPAAPGFQLI